MTRVLLVGAEARARWPRLTHALSPLLGAIDVEKMRQANKAVDLEGLPRGEAARRLMEASRPGE